LRDLKEYADPDRCGAREKPPVPIGETQSAAARNDVIGQQVQRFVSAFGRIELGLGNQR
jgi:hypothetical protein